MLLAGVAMWLLKDLQGMFLAAWLHPCYSLLFSQLDSSMRSFRSSPCGASACLSRGGWTGSGGGGLPTHSSAWKDPFQGYIGSHGSQGTGNPPSYVKKTETEVNYNALAFSFQLRCYANDKGIFCIRQHLPVLRILHLFSWPSVRSSLPVMAQSPSSQGEQYPSITTKNTP